MLKSTKNISFCFLLILIVLTLFLITSCTKCVDGYAEFRTEKGIAKFLFEYPCDWKISSVEINRQLGNTKYTSVFIEASGIIHGNNSISSTWVSILFCTPDVEIPNAKVALNDKLYFWEHNLNDFVLLDRSMVELDGVYGEQIQYSYRTGYSAPPGEPGRYGNEPRIHRDMFFDYNGIIIDISISSHDEVMEEHAVYIRHFLESFKFLD